MPKMDNAPSIILVDPQMGENIGAAARVMHNFGFSDLRIVNPRDGWPNDKAIAMAAGGDALIKQARLYGTLADALEGVEYSYAVTARRRDMHKPKVMLNDIDISNCNTAFIFGSERSGLTNEQVTYADAIVSIPANPEYPSLNLAQAVGVVCYECSTKEDAAQNPIEKSIDWADKKELAMLIEFFVNQLEERDFFTLNKKESMENHLRNIFMSRQFTRSELQSLWGVLKALSK